MTLSALSPGFNQQASGETPIRAPLCAALASGELLIRGSCFIRCVQLIAVRAGALKIVESPRSEQLGAAYVCGALRADGHSASVDDVRPSGTWGPMLDPPHAQDVNVVTAAMKCCFGGVGLGACGLVRAYTDALAQVLLGAGRTPIVLRQALRCRMQYAQDGLIRR